MKLPRIALALFALLALCASSARALEYWWERDFEFANKLTAPARKYFDLAETVLTKLEDNPDIIGIQKAKLLHRIGDFFAEKADDYATGRNWRERMVEYINKSRQYYQKFLAQDAAQPGGRLAGEAFRVRTRVSWLSLSLAEGEAKAYDAEGLTKEAKKEIKDKVVKLFEAAIEEFRKAMPDKDREIQDLLKKEPRNATEAVAWREKVLDPVRVESFMVAHLYCQGRLRLAKFLRDTKTSEIEVDKLLKDVEKDFTDSKGGILFKFYTLSAVLPNAKLTLCHCLFDQGPVRDKDLDERIEDLWSARQNYAVKRIPCDAQFLRVKVYMRQKKYKEALQADDDLLKYRTEVWGAEAKGPNAAQAVKEILEFFAGAPPDEYDQRSIAAAILLEADAYAGLAAEAAEQKKSPPTVQKLYATAHNLAVGVRLAKVPMDRKYAALMESWREKGRLPLAIPDRLVLLETALREKEYDKAAVITSDLIRDGGFSRDTVHERWMDVGRFYLACKRYHDAYTVFWAVARWYPDRNQAGACSLTLKAIEMEREASKGTPAEAFDLALYERARRDVVILLKVETAIPIRDGKELHKKGLFDAALAEFKKIGPDTKFYAEALFETAQTRRAMAEKAYRADKKSETAKAAAKACEDAFDALDAYYQKKLPTLGEDVEKADDRKRLILTGTFGFVARLTVLLEEFLNKPAKVLELTAPGFERKYPGIEAVATPPAYGLALFYRIRAAYALVRADPDHADPNLAILEDGWKSLCEKTKQFPHLDKAAATGAGAYGLVADRLDTLVKTAQTPEELKKVTDPELLKRLSDPAEVQKMAARVLVLKNRSMDFYFQLIAANPKQPLNTYRFIIMTLYQRDVMPRTPDFRKIVELTPPLLEELKDDTDPTITAVALQLKAVLGICYAQLNQFDNAIPILEEVDTAYEKSYQENLKNWTDRKTKKEEYEAKKDPRALKTKVGDQPARAAFQPDAKYWLGRSYLGGNVAPKYPAAVKLFTQLITIHNATQAWPKFWDVFYWYCEANVKMGNFADAVGQINRIILRDPNLHDKETKARFLQFLRRIKPDVDKDPKLRDQLDEILKTLGK